MPPLLWALGFLCMGSSTQAAAAGAVHLRGSSNLVPMAQYMAETYMRDQTTATIVVSGGGTYRGYKALLDGTADIAMVSSAPQEDVQHLLGDKPPAFKSTVVGYTAIVPVVHPTNPLRNVTLAQLQGIFTGRINNWKSLSGKDMPIRVLIGAPSDGLTETWRLSVIGRDSPFTPKSQVMDVGQRLSKVAAQADSITFISVGELAAGVRALPVNGVNASNDAVRDGRYVLGAPLMLVTLQQPSQATQNFVRYFSTPNKRLRFDGIITVETRD
jgi:phosphate transport system substrate-binding protein